MEVTRGFLLALDACTREGSAAIFSRDGELIADAVITLEGGNSGALMPLITGMMRDHSIHPSQLAGVFCGGGPGSFTGLRIAASIAKGLATGLSIPLYSVSSLLLIPAGVKDGIAPGEYLALLDAMRGEHHALHCSVDEDGIVTAAGHVELLDPAAVASRLKHSDMDLIALGPGQTTNALPHARGVLRLSHWRSPMSPVDTDSWEPVYGRLAEAEVRLNARIAADKGR